MGGPPVSGSSPVAIEVERRPGEFTFVSGSWPDLAEVAHASVVEAEGTTLVVKVDDALGAGAKVEFVAAWLTLTIFSSLDDVGLTGAVSAALTELGIPCNVLAGFHHDHLLVPVDRCGDAMAQIRSISWFPGRLAP